MWQSGLARAQSAATPRAAFFAERERALVEKLAARIVPGDERSAGAVGTGAYIGFVLSHAPAELQKIWRVALKRLGPRVDADVDALLVEISRNEFAPRTADERFFALLKGAVVDAFYTSEEGIRKELGYLGGGFVHGFAGCTHEAHAVPDGYKPLIGRPQ